MAHCMLQGPVAAVFVAGRGALFCNIETGKQETVDEFHLTDGAVPCSFDGRRVLVVYALDGARQRRVCLWDLESKATVIDTRLDNDEAGERSGSFRLLPRSTPETEAGGVAFVRDGSTLVTFNLATNTMTAAMRHKAKIVAYNVLQDGSILSMTATHVYRWHDGKCAETISIAPAQPSFVAGYPYHVLGLVDGAVIFNDDNALFAIKG
eukprot:g2512.t1